MAKITIGRLPNATPEYDRTQFDTLTNLDCNTWQLAANFWQPVTMAYEKLQFGIRF